ncbi:hypothetical protein [Verrucomicrobium sp. 3C]|uniref:hypothetical protein n=1 Tax=Verrucomicrobium sp. 3C TaxID=1134055 RepID=UPI0003611634|nr:hypothetical protein [Verrucomicrobium sp. 3C]
MPPTLLFLQQSLNSAIDRLRPSVWLALAAAAIYLLVTLLLANITAALSHGTSAGAFGILLSQGIFGILVVGLARFFLCLADGKEARLEELLYGFGAPWKSVAGVLFGWVSGIVALLGLLFPAIAPLSALAVLGLFPLFMFAPFLIADEAVSGVTETFVEAYQLGRSHYAKTLAIAVPVAFLFFLSAILFLAILVNIPICYALVAVAYRSLVSHPQ